MLNMQSANDVQAYSIQKSIQDKTVLVDDLICVESPLEILIPVATYDSDIEYKTLAITMRTPGDDESLAIGFLYAEGFIKSFDDITEMVYASERGTAGVHNSLEVRLRKPLSQDVLIPERRLTSYSSCGLCGKTTIQNLELQNPPILDETQQIIQKKLLSLMCTQMNERQVIFHQTGSVHASALFNKTGELLHLAEDIGRHNALDKLIGHCLTNNSDRLKQSVLVVSGRASFEMVQKTIMAGIPVLLAIGAPSSLAIDTAKRFNLTLIGHFRKNEFNIYNAPWRLT